MTRLIFEISTHYKIIVILIQNFMWSRRQLSKNAWQAGVLKNLQSLPSTEPPDCCIIVGTERIPVHKTALQLNSSLLTSGDVTYNKQSELIEIEVVPEFSEHFLLVSKIVDSFYTGYPDIVGENLIIVYKFAKCYSIQWMMDYVRPMFVDYIKKDERVQRFVEILKFAQSIWCTDLSDSCCELLDSELLGKISEPDVISQFDFFTIKSITSSEKLRIPEKDVFDLVVVWLKLNSTRCQNFGAILENIQYHLIESYYLSDTVFDIVLEEPNLPDSSRKTVLKKVRDSMKQVPERNTRFMITEKPSGSGTSSSVVRTFSPDNDACLHKIDMWMRGKRQDGNKAIKISEEELKSVITDKFRFMVDTDREVVINYLCTKSQIIINVFHLLLPVYDVYPNFKLLWLHLEHCTETNYQVLYDVPWQLVSFPTISAILTSSVMLELLLEYDCKRKYKMSQEGRSYHSIYSERFEGCGQVEIIMLWALANPLQKDKIKQLLDTVCFQKIPQQYKEIILLPSVMTIFPDKTNLTCSHNHSDQDKGLQLMDMRVAGMPAKIYFLQYFNDRLSCDTLYYELSFLPENKSSCISLQSHGNLKGCYEYDYSLDKIHSFILFDASKPHLPKYPLFVRKSGLFAIEGIVKRSTNIQYMFYKRADE